MHILGWNFWLFGPKIWFSSGGAWWTSAWVRGRESQYLPRYGTLFFFFTTALGNTGLRSVGLSEFWGWGWPKNALFGLKFSTFWTENMILFRWCLVDVGIGPRSWIAIFDEIQHLFFFCTTALGHWHRSEVLNRKVWLKNVFFLSCRRSLRSHQHSPNLKQWARRRSLCSPCVSMGLRAPPCVPK